MCQHLPNCTRVIKMAKTREFHPPISWNHTWKTSATICFVSPVDLRVLWVPCLYIIMFVAQVSWTKCVTIQKHTFCQAFLKALSWQKTAGEVTPGLLKPSSVSLLSHSSWSLLTPENCTWTRINLDLVCALDGFRRLENMLGWILNLLCCFWRPANVHFLRHGHPYPTPEHLEIVCTVLRCGSQLDKDNSCWMISDTNCHLPVPCGILNPPGLSVRTLSKR